MKQFSLGAIECKEVCALAVFARDKPPTACASTACLGQEKGTRVALAPRPQSYALCSAGHDGPLAPLPGLHSPPVLPRRPPKA